MWVKNAHDRPTRTIQPTGDVASDAEPGLRQAQQQFGFVDEALRGVLRDQVEDLERGHFFLQGFILLQHSCQHLLFVVQVLWFLTFLNFLFQVFLFRVKV